MGEGLRIPLGLTVDWNSEPKRLSKRKRGSVLPRGGGEEVALQLQQEIPAICGGQTVIPGGGEGPPKRAKARIQREEEGNRQKGKNINCVKKLRYRF